MPERNLQELLKENIGKKFMTVTVFPLDLFEKEFGHLWGSNKPEHELTPEEKLNRESWKLIRDKIFDKGNFHRRNALKELDKYRVVQKTYNTRFQPYKD